MRRELSMTKVLLVGLGRWGHLGRRAPGQPEAEEDHRAGGHVRQVVDRIAQQPDRPGQHGQQQLDQAGDAQADRADRNRAVGLPPLVGVISRPGKRKAQAGSRCPRVLCIRPG